MKQDSDFKDYAINAMAGWASGFSTGLIISPLEAIKVYVQTSKPPRNFFSPELWSYIGKSAVPFSFKFSLICAVEFSINTKIAKEYGAVPGITASAITGAIGLTVADHIMFRRLKLSETKNSTTAWKIYKELYHIRPLAPWTGFSPMIAREAIFILSVMHLGPHLGQIFQKNFSLANKNQDIDKNSRLQYSILGRVCTGIVTTLLSQPFDSFAREMQKQLYNEPEKSPSILEILKKTSFKSLYLGAVPRMGLSTFGGTMAGTIYDVLRNQVKPVEHDTLITPQRKR